MTRDLNHPDALDAILNRIDEATAKIIAALAGTSRPTGGQSSAPATSGRPVDGTFKFGRQKGQPLNAGTAENLEWYRTAIRQSIDDPAKSRWRTDNLAHLADIEAAMGIESSMAGAPSSGGGIDFANLPGDDEIPF